MNDDSATSSVKERKQLRIPQGMDIGPPLASAEQKWKFFGEGQGPKAWAVFIRLTASRRRRCFKKQSPAACR
ncbi:hypothetical protein [Candidatus Laterigemmans baculatus]|uniref:hypothetical protein n=1 Tax=Candidatus Laterigemmans baculatus TaxID=2770505 RepID=UPI0013DB8256|nr:hypothetical protein [Candidatus Laterigemmans baculatus]